MSGGGNPYHDPKNGEFTSGPGGNAGDGGGAESTFKPALGQALGINQSGGTADIVTYATDLSKNMLDNQQFDKTVSALRQDRSILAPEMREIAKQVLGYEVRKSEGRSGALKEITDTQMVRARNEARGKEIDKRNKSW